MEPDPDLQEPHPVFYERLDGTLIQTVALKMDGVGGPSGIDGLGWKRLCTAFGPHSADLCNSLTSTTKRLCTEYVDPKGIEVLVASKFIALDKCPGIRPIGVGETVRHPQPVLGILVGAQDHCSYPLTLEHNVGEGSLHFVC